MELFDKRFVHFMWDDKLKGKNCFVADNIAELRAFVNGSNEHNLCCVSSAEMIADFITRFKVKCPSYCEPLIWVGLKHQDCWFLITGIFSYSVKINGTLCMLENLFNCYTYRDGSPVGMEVQE